MIACGKYRDIDYVTGCVKNLASEARRVRPLLIKQ